MLDRQIGLPGPQPEPTAAPPTNREARVQLERTVDQRDGGYNVFAEVSQNVSAVSEDIRVIARGRKRPARQPQCLIAVRTDIVDPSGDIE